MNFNCESLPGIAELDFYLLSETSNWPIVVTDQNAADVVINPEDVDVEAALEPDSIEIDATPRTTAEGNVYPIDISMKFLTRSESLEQLLEQYANQPGIVVAKLNTGFCKMYGTNEEPLYMNFKVDEGKKTSDAAGTILNIKGETRNRPVYYTV